MMNSPKMMRPKREVPEYEQKLLGVDRVVRVVAGGRRLRFRAIMVIGDRKGKVGVGAAKGADVSMGVEKATHKAQKHLIKVPLVDGTIPHQVEAKYNSAKVMLKPAMKGRGIMAGGAMRSVCVLAGIENISAKILSRSKNKLNIAQATIKALKKLKNYAAFSAKTRA